MQHYKKTEKKNIKNNRNSEFHPISLTAQESTAKEVDFVWPDQNLWSQRV